MKNLILTKNVLLDDLDIAKLYKDEKTKESAMVEKDVFVWGHFSTLKINQKIVFKKNVIHQPLVGIFSQLFLPPPQKNPPQTKIKFFLLLLKFYGGNLNTVFLGLCLTRFFCVGSYSSSSYGFLSSTRPRKTNCDILNQTTISTNHRLVFTSPIFPRSPYSPELTGREI